MKDYYSLLAIEPTASSEEVKRAFRTHIARYHPDKVQHLGDEFQALAAERSAQLTEAYRVLSDAAQRTEYDRGRESAAANTPSVSGDKGPPEHQENASTPAEPWGEKPAARSMASDQHRDQVVRKATLDRFRQVLARSGRYDEMQLQGFDIACLPRPGLFGRSKGPRIVGQFVPRVDSESIAETWVQAVRAAGSEPEQICVFVLGLALASRAELSAAISAQRRKSPENKVVVIPVDTRDWSAHVPTDAPAVAKNLVALFG